MQKRKSIGNKFQNNKQNKPSVETNAPDSEMAMGR
jgi:hypothetical protein